MNKEYQKQRSIIVKGFHTVIAPFLKDLNNAREEDRVKIFIDKTQTLYNDYREKITVLGPPGYFGSVEE